MNNQINNRSERLKKKVICYYLAMARGHRKIKGLQEHLIMHPYFNPILLFKKISRGHSVLTKNDYKEYIQKCWPDLTTTVIEIYMKKHNLNTIIECQQFIATILPYTPDILRNLTATVVWQVKSSPSLNRDIQILFRQIIRTEIEQIMNISSFRNQIPVRWCEIKEMIHRDLQQLCKNSIQDQLMMIKLRNWIQLWIDVDEKDVLDMIRWMGGPSQVELKRNFYELYEKNIKNLDNEQNCLQIKQRPSKNKIIHLRSLSLKNMSRKQREMLQRKISYIKESIKKNELNKYAQSMKDLRETRSEKDSATWANSRSIRQQQNKYAFQLFSQYIFSLLSGEKVLHQKRYFLGPYILEVIEILKEELMSKKNKMTKISKIISFIEKQSGLSLNDKKWLNQTLCDLSIENQVITSIFTSNFEETKNLNRSQMNWYLDEYSNQQRKKSIRNQVSETLKCYCITKFKLIQTSKKMISESHQKQVYKILISDQKKVVKKENLIKILDQLKIECSDENLKILLKHFGDGNEINQQSFFRVFHIQGK